VGALQLVAGEYDGYLVAVASAAAGSATGESLLAGSRLVEQTGCQSQVQIENLRQVQAVSAESRLVRQRGADRGYR
jgi:hypothetical protein